MASSIILGKERIIMFLRVKKCDEVIINKIQENKADWEGKYLRAMNYIYRQTAGINLRGRKCP